LSVINAQNYSSGIDVGADLTPRITTESEILVMGISQRTNNTAEARSSGVIPKTWERFMKEGPLQKIPNRTDANIIALYTDYASDKDGDYSFVLGAKVTDGGQVPSGMVLKRIPAGRYAVLTSDKGPVNVVVPSAWKRIWSMSREVLGGAARLQSRLRSVRSARN
jgi:predicted transcriptional regulator YdeE